MIGGLTVTTVTQTQLGHPAPVEPADRGQAVQLQLDQENRRDLIILVTPRIVDDGISTALRHPDPGSDTSPAQVGSSFPRFSKAQRAMRLRFTTAGESHGKALPAIVEGLPAGLPLDRRVVDRELARRMQGYGRGAG